SRGTSSELPLRPRHRALHSAGSRQFDYVRRLSCPSPTEKNRPNLGNRRLNVPAVYIIPQLGHCQHAPSLPGRADTYPHPLISLMLRQTVEGVAWQRDWTKTIRTSTSIAGTSKPTSRLGKIN